jgi:competence protein ComGC
MLYKFLKERKAQSNMNTLYMLLIAAIVAVILIGIIKPMFKQGTSISKAQPVEAPTK